MIQHVYLNHGFSEKKNKQNYSTMKKNVNTESSFKDILNSVMKEMKK